jgi:hypothetical protein
MSELIPSSQQQADMSPSASVVTSGLLHDGAIVTFTLKGNPSRELVDQWFNLVADVVKKWPTEKVYLAMHDFSDERVAFTHYARVRVKEFEPLVARLHGRIALILMPNLQGQIIRIALRSFRWQRRLRTEAFFTYESALLWLEEGLTAKYPGDSHGKVKHIHW